MVRPRSEPPKRPAAHRDWPATNRMPEERELTPRQTLLWMIGGALLALVIMALVFGTLWSLAR